MENKKIDFSDVSTQHRNMIVSFGVPDWISKLKCTKCGEELDFLSIRSLETRTNAQHIGKLAIDICCKTCNYGYTLFSKQQFDSMKSCMEVFLDETKKLSQDDFMPSYEIQHFENNLAKQIIKESICQ